MAVSAQLGATAYRQGDYAAAAGLYKEALWMEWTAGSRRRATQYLARLAAVQAASGNTERAARLYGAAEMLYEHLGVTWIIPDGDRVHVDAMRATLGDDAYNEIWSEGRSFSDAEAVEYALQAGDAS